MALCVERSPELVICILGILKSGAAYVPLDPEYPLERLGYMLDDTGARVLVSSPGVCDALEATVAHVLQESFSFSGQVVFIQSAPINDIKP